MGYQVEKIPGRQLLESGSAEFDGRVMPVSAQVELHEFSVHTVRDGLLDFVDDYRDAEVLLNHGDRCEAFAEELRTDGYEARAPELGETLTVSLLSVDQRSVTTVTDELAMRKIVTARTVHSVGRLERSSRVDDRFHLVGEVHQIPDGRPLRTGRQAVCVLLREVRTLYVYVDADVVERLF